MNKRCKKKRLAQVIQINPTIRLMHHLCKRAEQGEIRGIVVGVLSSTHDCESYWSGKLGLLRKVGLAENLKQAIMDLHYTEDITW